MHKSLEEVQCIFMRMALWVGKGTPHSILLRETGRYRMILGCLHNSITFWNKLCSREESCLLVRVAKEGLTLRTGWVWQLANAVLKATGIEATLMRDNKLTRLDTANVMKLAATAIDARDRRIFSSLVMRDLNNVGSTVRACPDHVRDGFKVFKHMQWFYDGHDNTPVMSYLQDVNDIRILSRFRCGMHWLATEKGRTNTVGRSMRTCTCCMRGEREDELHVLFCDAYAHARRRFPTVFESESFLKLKRAYDYDETDLDEHMKKFMNKKDSLHIGGLVGYLRCSVTIRDNINVSIGS